MTIKIYGAGCQKCNTLTERVQAAVAQLGLQADIEKVTDIDAITGAGVLMTPALEVDGRVVCNGRLPSADEIAGWLNGDAPVAKTPSAPKKTGKNVLTALLLALVAASVIAVIVREARTPKPAATEIPASSQTVTVYYFHGNTRCVTCNTIEALTRQAIESKYADRVVMRSVNVDAPENAHFIRDFGLTNNGVVMQKGGAHEVFDKVWTLVREPDAFIPYIQDGVARMLAAPAPETP